MSIQKIVLIPHETLTDEQLELCQTYIQTNAEELTFEVGGFIHARIGEENQKHVVLYVRRMEPENVFYGKLDPDAEITVEQINHEDPPPSFRALKPSLADIVPGIDPIEEPEISGPQLEQEPITFLAEIGQKDTIIIPTEYMNQHELYIGNVIHVILKKRD